MSLLGALVGGDSSSSSSTVKYDNQAISVADYGKLDVGGGSTAVKLSGVRANTVSLSLLDQGAIAKAFGFASHAFDESSGLASQAIKNANTQAVSQHANTVQMIAVLGGLGLILWVAKRRR